MQRSQWTLINPFLSQEEADERNNLGQYVYPPLQALQPYAVDQIHLGHRARIVGRAVAVSLGRLEPDHAELGFDKGKFRESIWPPPFSLFATPDL
ncbi:MAG: hypothetical protein JO170_33790 [Verrucomicrobia bacterium]|nr:hypothetical protein [Verrucomicrobiota bacterium]